MSGTTNFSESGQGHVRVENWEQDDLEDMSLLDMVQKAAREQHVEMCDVTSVSFRHTEVAFARREMNALLEACPQISKFDLAYTHVGGDDYVSWLIEWANDPGHMINITKTWNSVKFKERLTRDNRLKRPENIIVDTP